MEPAAPAAEHGRARPRATGAAQGLALARRLAKEEAVDLTAASGSGPAGGSSRRTSASARRARPAGAPRRGEWDPGPEAPETAKGTVCYVEPTQAAGDVARRMAESKATAPHFYLQAEIDMSRAVEARARIKATAAEGEVVPSFNDMVVKACALALREHPLANGAYRDGRFELYSRINVGVAVAAQDALVVPTVFDADRKGLREIAADSRALAHGSATGRSPRRSSPAAPSRSPTSGCTGSTASPR